MNIRNTTSAETVEERTSQLKYKIAYQILAEEAVFAWEEYLKMTLDKESKDEIIRLAFTTERNEIDANLALERNDQFPTYKRISTCINAALRLIKMGSFEEVNLMRIEEIEEKVSFKDLAPTMPPIVKPHKTAAEKKLAEMRRKQMLASKKERQEAVVPIKKEAAPMPQPNLTPVPDTALEAFLADSSSSSDDDLDYSDSLRPTLERSSEITGYSSYSVFKKVPTHREGLSELEKASNSDSNDSSSSENEAKPASERRKKSSHLFARAAKATILVGSLPGADSQSASTSLKKTPSRQ